MTNILNILVPILIVFTSDSVSYTETSKTKTLYLNDISSSIDSIAVKHKLPGISVSIVSKDSIIGIYYYGFSNLKKKIKINSNTQFKVGSITKSFLALAFIKLSDEGKIDLDLPIKELIPEIEYINPWQDTHPIRIIHLLEHTSGFDDIHTNDLCLEDISDLPLKQVLKFQKNSLTSRWKPGTYSSYSSVGYTMLGYILEKVTNMTYEKYLQQEILAPCKMDSSSLELKEFPLHSTIGYDENYNILPNIYMYARPAGSMFSTIKDMSKFIHMMLNFGRIDNQQLFSEDLIKSMETPQSGLATMNGVQIGFGSGIMSTQKNGQKWYYHNGGGPGCLASYYYSHELDRGFCIMTNSFNIEAISSVKALLFNRLKKNLQHTDNTQSIIKNKSKESFIGYFELKNHRNEKFSFIDAIFGGIKVFKQGDTLVIKELFVPDEIIVSYKNNMYRKIGENEASICLYKTELNKMGLFINNNYYEKSSYLKFLSIWIYIGLFPILIIFLIIDFLTSLIKYLIQWGLKKKPRTKNLVSGLLHLLTLSTLIIPIILVSSQSTVELTQRTIENRLLYSGGWVFFIMSFINVLYSIRCRIHYSKSNWQNIYIASSILIFSLAIMLLALGIIGLKLWNY